MNTREKNITKNQLMCYYFDVDKCKDCPNKDGYYKDGSKSKTCLISIFSNRHFEQKEFKETEYFNIRIKQLYMIEVKNSELKQAYGLNIWV